MDQESSPRLRPPLLLLCHRIPYPPNKGDKIRSYHLLKHLAQRFRIYLGAFIDDPHDWRYAEDVRALCEDTCLVALNPVWARARSLTAFLSGEALSVPYYRDARLQRWVIETSRSVGFQLAVAFSSPMAQYLWLDALPNAHCIVDFVDVDSDKWRQYAQSKPVWEAWLYRREAKKLAAFEHLAATRATAVTLVSVAEAALFRDRIDDPDVRVLDVPNGVDTDYFAPVPERASPFSAGERPVVFTGAMDYWANADAVCWFAQAVLPRVREACPAARFYIVGSNPSSRVRALAGDAVVVTGRVEDVRPYLQHAGVIVAPMRIARGIQNKVLEGMAMGNIVVTTSQGFEGLNAAPGTDVQVADDAEAFSAAVIEVLEHPDPALGPAARNRVIDAYAWSAALAPFDALLN